MRSIIALIAGLAVFLPMIAAECPNACSAHGKCGAYDMCLCYRNWMANDCSERICQFGLAHVDTPKGDLDASSGELSGPGTTVVLNDAVYPFGTTEQYPATLDLNGNVLTNTAHEYRECSNKGLCDRATGQCACFEGYDGSACQRASCPSNADGMCSGHGTCETIAEISARDFHNHYNLWDEDTTMGCVCDAGFTGPDCSDRVCKWGADPLYYDDQQNIRYSNWTYQFYTTTQNAKLTGNYSIVFYDAHGEDWQTAPLDWNATCEVVTAALEDIPNNVIPKDSVRCYKSETTIGSGNSNGQDASWDPIVDTSMYVYSKYTIAFPENPGKLKQITINKFLDGTRPTLYSDETTSSLGWHIYPNGFIGENTDHVADLCEDVKVSLAAATNDHYLTGLTTAEAKLLKKCLGTSDGDDTNNKDVYNWDYGDAKNPHLIKLVDATQDSSIATTDRFGDTDLDYALSKYPISRLCSKSDAGYKTKAGGFPVDAYGINICASRNPPGFYAVLYYSETVSTTYPFRLYTRAAANYGSTTEFYVFTTTGYLQLVTPYAAAFTKSAVVTGAAKAKYHYTNTVYVSNTTTDNTIITGSPYNSVAPFGMTKQDGFLGDVSCETNPKGTYYAFDCLKKNDYVMFLNTFAATRTAADLASNPIYPNIYTVKKINRGPRFPSATGAVDANSEWRRNQIQLDYSMNSEFEFAGGFTSATDTSAAIYKFYPPQQGHSYQYAAECSNRGLCNKKSGICQCFPGFADDNCAKINALSN